MAGPYADLSPVIAASTHWLARAYPSATAGLIAHSRAELQIRQAVTVAARLRYPTEMDAALVALAGPGGSTLLDWRVGSEPDDEMAAGEGWRTWVDEVVVSWAACLLADPALAARAVDSVASAVPAADDLPHPRRPSPAGRPSEFCRLTDPDPRDLDASVLLRHPDLLEPVSSMHRDDLHYLLGHPRLRATPARLTRASRSAATAAAERANRRGGAGSRRWRSGPSRRW